MNAPPLPVISPVELMLASVGIRAIISRQVEKITKTQLDEMVRLPSAVLRMSRQIVSGQEFESTFGHDSYRDLLVDLAKGWDPEQVEQMMDQVPTEYHTVAQALIVKAGELIKQMDAEYPVSKYITMSGETRLATSDAKSFQFLSVLECIDHPLVMFELMSTGALLQTQAQAVREVYPSLSEAIDTCLIDSITRARAAKASFQLPQKAERGIRAWFGKGPIPLKSMARAQDVAKIQAAKEQAQAQAKADAKKANLTTVQRDELA